MRPNQESKITTSILLFKKNLYLLFSLEQKHEISRETERFFDGGFLFIFVRFTLYQLKNYPTFYFNRETYLLVCWIHIHTTLSQRNTRLSLDQVRMVSVCPTYPLSYHCRVVVSVKSAFILPCKLLDGLGLCVLLHTTEANFRDFKCTGALDMQTIQNLIFKPENDISIWFGISPIAILNSQYPNWFMCLLDINSVNRVGGLITAESLAIVLQCRLVNRGRTIFQKYVTYCLICNIQCHLKIFSTKTNCQFLSGKQPFSSNVGL